MYRVRPFLVEQQKNDDDDGDDDEANDSNNDADYNWHIIISFAISTWYKYHQH